MEYKELESLWKRYDEKLDKLEKINKKLLKDSLLNKPQKKLNWMKFQSLYAVIITPVVLVVALHPHFKIENLDWKFILGCVLMLVFVLYLCIENFRIYLILKKINLSADTIIHSLGKVLKIKKIADCHRKYVFLYYPIGFIGIILIGWNGFVFSLKTIIYLCIFFVITYIMNIWGARKYKERMSKLEKDIVELKEYIEE